MKLKKFFAGVLAAAMMLTVGATAAFAATGVDATYPGKLANTMQVCLCRITVRLKLI